MGVRRHLRHRHPVAMACLAVLWAAVAAPAGATAADRPATTLTDDAGRQVALPERIDRVFAAGPPAAVLLFVLAPDKLIGWPWPLQDGAAALLPAPYGALPQVGGLGGRGASASAETVAALKPDLILDAGTVDPTYASMAERIQGQTAIPYVLLGGRFTDTPALLRRAGALLGRGERGETLAAFAQTIIDEVSATAAAIPPGERVRVYFARGPKGLETGGSASINAELIRLAGGANVADDAPAPGLRQVSLEQLIRWDPDVILVEQRSLREEALAQPAWQQLRAVRQHRVYAVPGLPFGWADSPPGVNRVVGAAWLAQLLYPQRFHFDIPALGRDFYARFYGITLSDAQWAAIVEGAGLR